MLQVGERYELLKVLGYGSYSAVVLALDRSTGEKVRGHCRCTVSLSKRAGRWAGANAC